MMNALLQPFLCKFTAVFFDDIQVYSETLLSHLHQLEIIFQTLLQGKFYLKRSKCLFSQRQLKYLGHIISGKGVEPEQSKIKAIVDWPVPSTQKDIRGFLGFTSFYHKLVKRYASIASQLTSLLWKDDFVWTSSS